jgi:ABC-2 type transport system ATP-binding protein
MEEADPCDHVAIVAHGRIVASGDPEELRRTLRRESIEIAGARLDGLAARVTALTGVEPRTTPTGLSLIVDDAALVLPSLLPLTSEGAEVRVSRPTLEDVFLALTRDEDGAAA